MATNSQVIHAWAHQTGRHTRASNGNVFYDGRTLFSYGRHFPVASIVTDVTGRDVVLHSAGSYSVTTSGHQSAARQATNHMPGFTVNDVMPRGELGHRSNFNALVGKAGEVFDKAKRARSNREWKLAEGDRLLRDAAGYARAFGLADVNVPTPEDLCATVEELRQAAKRLEAERREAARLAAIEHKRKQRDDIRAWLRGEPGVRAPRTAIPMVRVKGDTLETTWGASVPLEDALRVYRVAQHKRGQNGSTYETAKPVGDFGRATIDGKGVIRVGCHTIPFRYAKVAACLAGLDGEPS
jgi:hypothetical protein